MRTNGKTFQLIDGLCDVACFNGELVARLRDALPPDEDVDDVQVLFAALADKTRLKVLHIFASGEELCVCDVAHVLNVTVSTASHHLRRLRDLKLLRHRNDGRMSFYSCREPLAGRLVKEALRAQMGSGRP